MAGETQVTVIGNLAADPERRAVGNGAVVTSFVVVSTPRTKKGEQWVDGEPATWRCQVWRQPAENVAESLRKGDRVVVVGNLAQRSYENKEGEKKTVLEIQAEEVGASLRFATCRPARNQRRAA
jgi:single-strand DNA-binding protein